MSTTLSELQEWDEKILKWVERYKLNCYTQEFEICDHHEMLGYMAYSGMPSRYSHWSYGKGFERQKMMYDYGVSGLPYEMVINSDPCLAYLMRDNSLLLQILTIAHVYGHNDFFKNNFTFTSGFPAKYALEMFKNHSSRVDSYIQDPSIGIDLVEDTLDHAHSLQFQCRRNLAIKKRSHQEQYERALEQAAPSADPYANIHPKQVYTQPEIDRFPIEPEEDILGFISKYNPYLPEWKRDLIRIVETEAKYFIPQMETKIMNEGWASYWHYKIMNSLELPQGLHMEFMVAHHQVLRPHPGGLNPYHLGFLIWHDIEKRWNEKAGLKDVPADAVDTPGRKKIFEVRESDRDSSFLRRFLTRELMEEAHLFQHEKRGKERVITKVATEEDWEEIKSILIKQVGAGSLPIIKITDADFGKNRTLYLVHEHDGRDLQLQYAEATLRHIQALWERDVVLETTVNGKKSLLKMSKDSMKVEKLD